MRITLSIFIFSILCNCVLCQNKAKVHLIPEVNKRCPDFTLNEVYGLEKRKVTIDDFKGKWLILDFWSVHCGSCVRSFPTVNSLQARFKRQFQFLLVCDNSNGENIYAHKLYSKYESYYNLKLPIAYDSTVVNMFNIQAYPCIIVIDPNGIVKGITPHLTDLNLVNFIKGVSQVFEKTSLTKEGTGNNYNASRPFLVNGNGGNDSLFIYRTLISRWQPSMPGPYSGPSKVSIGMQFQALGYDIISLYKYAYIGRPYILGGDSLYGSFFPIPILEVKDSTIFKFDIPTGRNLFCISMSVPFVATMQYFMSTMQSDLRNVFKYQVTIEKRVMPYWALVATDSAKINLQTKGGESKFSSLERYQTSTLDGFKFENEPIRLLVNLLFNYDKIPIVDETGIEGNIDIKIRGLKTDKIDFKRALNENGLDLMKRNKMMSVLVIKD